MTFDEAFHEVRRRKVGGGAKSTGADEITWAGQLEGGPALVLVSRVRLNNPMESFLTCSSHRLRDSHVGRGGYWIDIRVTGECSDAEMETIRQMAQAADETRPVAVRRAK